MGKLVNLGGLRFGRWLVLQRTSDARWLCVCDCGRQFPIRGNHLTSGASKGCHFCARKTHGHASNGTMTQTYRIWSYVMTRCHNPNNHAFPRYGGRGILVCAEWRSFDGFLRDMGERPAGAQIDRIDNNLGYQPGNCRWVTPLEQQRNKRTVKLNTEAVKVMRHCAARGVSHGLLARLHGINHSTASNVLSRKSWQDVGAARRAGRAA